MHAFIIPSICSVVPLVLHIITITIHLLNGFQTMNDQIRFLLDSVPSPITIHLEALIAEANHTLSRDFQAFCGCVRLGGFRVNVL